MRIQATVYTGNGASEGVLKKCGPQLEGIQQKAIYKHQQFFDARIYVALNSR